MLTDPKLRSQVDTLCNQFWTGGLDNRLDAIEHFFVNGPTTASYEIGSTAGEIRAGYFQEGYTDQPSRLNMATYSSTRRIQRRSIIALSVFIPVGMTSL